MENQNNSRPRPNSQNQNQQKNLPAQRPDSQPIALAGGRQFMPTVHQWTQIREMGIAAFKSGLLPQGIKNPEAAAIIGLKAFELGIPLMEGFAHIHVINGKPTISREMMQTLVTQNIPGAVIDILETSDKIATVEGRRPGRKPLKMSFTIEDAKRAQLLSKPGPWQQYPAAMLLNRVIAALCRAYFPDGLRGCSYTPEELEPAIETDYRHVESNTEVSHSDSETLTPQVDARSQEPITIPREVREIAAAVGKPGYWSRTQAETWVGVAYGKASLRDLSKDEAQDMLSAMVMSFESRTQFESLDAEMASRKENRLREADPENQGLGSTRNGAQTKSQPISGALCPSDESQATPEGQNAATSLETASEPDPDFNQDPTGFDAFAGGLSSGLHGDLLASSASQAKGIVRK